MSNTYGPQAGSTMTKDLEVTTAKYKIQVHSIIFMDGSTKEYYIAIKDHTGTYIPMEDVNPGDGWSAPYGSFIRHFSGNGDKTYLLTRQDHVNYTIGEILTIEINQTPWYTGNVTQFYLIELAEID